MTSNTLPGINRKGNSLLCIAWGETDCPSATIVKSTDQLMQCLVEQWTGDEKEAVAIVEEINNHDFYETKDTIEWEFEIGGFSVRDVFS